MDKISECFSPFGQRPNPLYTFTGHCLEFGCQKSTAVKYETFRLLSDGLISVRYNMVYSGLYECKQLCPANSLFNLFAGIKRFILARNVNE